MNTSNCGNVSKGGGAGAGGSNSCWSMKLKLTRSPMEEFGVDTQRMTDVSLDGPENDSSCETRLEICLFKLAVRRHPSPSAHRVASRVLTRMETAFRIELDSSSICSVPEKSRPPGSPASSLLDDTEN